MNNEEFYIGWQRIAPNSLAKYIKRVLIVLGVLVIGVAVVLSTGQKKFSTGNFEFGKLTEVTGIYTSLPVPSLKVVSKKDMFGNTDYITIPLIGFGKFGADGVLKEIEKESGTVLAQKELTLKGTLLYNDGKLLMQVDGNDKPLVKVVKTNSSIIAPVKKELGTMSLKGEIVDPKCYFGVMKPGQGKVHKDCAIRCILGGIPPVLRVIDKNGNANYYLIVGPQGERMNNAVQNYVAEPVSIISRAVQYNDWVVLYTNSADIQSISRRELVYDGTLAISCVRDCTKLP